MYAQGNSEKSLKFEPVSALAFFAGHGTADHRSRFSQCYSGSGEMVERINDGDTPTFRRLELPTVPKLKGYFASSQAELAKLAANAFSLEELRTRGVIYPAEGSNGKVFWRCAFDDGDIDDLNGNELMAALTAYARAHTPGAPPVVFPPSGRGDLLRRVRKVFYGEAYDGSVVDFINGRPTSKPKAKKLDVAGRRRATLGQRGSAAAGGRRKIGGVSTEYHGLKLLNSIKKSMYRVCRSFRRFR